MKKKLYLLFSLCLMIVVIITGCSLGNTPTKKVEMLLDSYKNSDSIVLSQLDDILKNDLTLEENSKEEYKKILKNQYQNLTYEIKDETIDGDIAIVTTEIEVYDLYKKTKQVEEYYNTNPKEFMDDDGTILDTKYIEYKLKELTNTKDRVKYTIDFTLTKINDVWVVDELSDTTLLKIHGLYEY